MLKTIDMPKAPPVEVRSTETKVTKKDNTVESSSLIDDALGGPTNINSFLDSHDMGAENVKKAEAAESELAQVKSKDIFDDSANEIALGEKSAPKDEPTNESKF